MAQEYNADMLCAETIREQLGGRMFVTMTGAKNFMFGERELQFSIGRNASGANKVRISLQSDDTYTVTFYRIRKAGLKVDVMFECDGIYAENLQSYFEKVTGLFTRL